MTEETRGEVVARLRQLADLSREGGAMDVFNMDIILAPSDSTLVTFAACAGWPIATVPLGRWEKNGQPYGYFAVARDVREDVLFRFMSVYYGTFNDVVERPQGLFSDKT
jgi:amidase